MKVKLLCTAATSDGMSDRDKSRREIAEFIDAANQAAIALYTISNVYMSLFASGKLQRDIAGKFMAICSALNMLNMIMELKSEPSLLRPHDTDLLSKSIDTCRPLVRKVTECAHRLDLHLADEPRSEGVGVQAKLNALNKGEAENPLCTLDECLRVIVGMIMTVRAERLSHRDTLTDSESSEALRLHLALLHIEKPAGPPTQMLFTGGQNVPGNISNFPLSKPPPPYKHSLPFQPNPFCIQQPAFPPSQPQHSLFPHLARIPSPQEPTHSSPTATMDTSKAHMETYILCPKVHSINNSSIMTYNIEPLHLEEGDIRAHVTKLSLKQSIVDAVTELLPDQLRIIQERARDRKGDLVSAQFGAEVDLVTQMGTFKTKSVVFVIKTAAEKEKEKVKYGGVPVKQGHEQFLCWQPKTESSAPTTAGAPPPLFSSTPPFANLHNFPASSSSAAPGFLTAAMNREGFVPLGGPGFFKEKDGFSTASMQEYMSISFSDKYRDKSFEEIRVADYKAGHAENAVVKPGFKPVASFAETCAVGPKVPSSGCTTATGAQLVGLFGQQLASASGGIAAGNTPCLFGQSTSTPVSGLFGQNNHTPTSGLFGGSKFATAPASVVQNKSNIASGLFASPAVYTPPSSSFNFSPKTFPASGALSTDSHKPPAPEARNYFKDLLKPPPTTMEILLMETAAKAKQPVPHTSSQRDDPPTIRTGESLKAFGDRVIEHSQNAKREVYATSKEEHGRQEVVDRMEKAERKQMMKEKDFDPDHETEQVWSARYERLESRRVADAKKAPKEPGAVYTVDTDGVVTGRPNSLLVSSDSGPSNVPAVEMFSALGTGGAPDVSGIGNGSKDGRAGDGGVKKGGSKGKETVVE